MDTDQLDPRRDDGARPIVVYDGLCPMCRRQAGTVRRLDWLRRLGDLPYEAAVTRYPEVSRGVLGDGLRVRFPDGSVTVGIDAVRSILVRLPIGIVGGLALFLPGIHWLGDRAYHLVAARRTTAACDDATCLPPARPGDGQAHTR